MIGMLLLRYEDARDEGPVSPVVGASGASCLRISRPIVSGPLFVCSLTHGRQVDATASEPDAQLSPHLSFTIGGRFPWVFFFIQPNENLNQ